MSANYPDGNSQYAESEVTGNPYTWTSYGTLYFRTSGTPSDYYTVHFTNGNELKRSYGDQCLYQNGVGINEGTCPANPGHFPVPVGLCRGHVESLVQRQER